MPRAKKVVVRRARTGVGAIPTESFEKAKFNIHYELNPKDAGTILKDFIQQKVSKEKFKKLTTLPEYKFTMHTHYVAAAFWKMKDLPCGDREMMYINGLNRYVDELIELSEKIVEEKKEKVEKPRLSPAQLLARKVNRTIMVELDQLEDAWIEGEKKEIELYKLFQVHELKGSAVSHVRPTIEGWLSEYDDALNKKCEQAVEAYSHLTKTELTRRVKSCEKMLADLESILESSKATRTPRKPKAKSVTSQTKNLKFKKQDNDFKLTSVNPISIVGAMRVLTFNTKTNQLTEFVSEHPDGFEVSGTTLKRFDVDLSRTKKLRKPAEFLPIAHKKTAKQFKKEFDALTTKASTPNGRFNEHLIILLAK